MAAIEQAAEPLAAPRPWRLAAPTGRVRAVLLGLAVPVAAALLWEAVVAAGLASGRLMPPPSRVLRELGELAAGGELASHVAATLTRVALGFAFGSVAGILLGALSGGSRLFRQVADPTLQGFRAIPSLAWVPLFILWLGIFEESKVTLIAVGVFFPVYLGVSAAVISVDRKIVEVGRTFRLTGPQMARRILLPAIMPEVLVALRTGLGLGWMFVVAAELMGASEGLGYLLVDGQQLGNPDQILAAIIVFALIGKASDGLLVLAGAPFLAWQDRVDTRR